MPARTAPSNSGADLQRPGQQPRGLADAQVRGPAPQVAQPSLQSDWAARAYVEPRANAPHATARHTGAKARSCADGRQRAPVAPEECRAASQPGPRARTQSPRRLPGQRNRRDQRPMSPRRASVIPARDEEQPEQERRRLAVLAVRPASTSNAESASKNSTQARARPRRTCMNSGNATSPRPHNSAGRARGQVRVREKEE